MVIFDLVIGGGLLVQGILALVNLLQWRRLSITSTLRRLAALAYFCLGSMFIFSAFWRQFYFGVFAALAFLILIQRKIILQRKVGIHSKG